MSTLGPFRLACKSLRSVLNYPCASNAEVAQLVEHHLAMVRVAGSNPVFRSGPGAEGAGGTTGRRPRVGGMAEWLGKGLQNPVPRFDSGCRLSEGAWKGSLVRAISSGGERFLDAEEVSGSNPLSPTLKILQFAGKT